MTARPADRETGSIVRVVVTSASRKLPLLRAIADQIADVDPTADVVAADADPTCLAAHAWRPFLPVPRTDRPDALLDAMTAGGSALVVPTSDADARFFTAHAAELLRRGSWVLGGPIDAVTACTDKLVFARVLAAAGLPSIPTAEDPAQVTGDRLVAKERHGAGARGLHLDLGRTDARAVASRLAAPVFQPFVPGPEISIDTYRARDGRVLGLVARSRDLVIDGESQVTTTIDPHPYVDLTAAVLAAVGLTGHALLQVIAAPSGPVVVECNPRLGGASTLSLAAGLRSLAWAWLEATGTDPAALPFTPEPPGLRLVRTPADTITRVLP